MAKTLQQILGYVKLCGIIQSTTSGVPSVLPDSFTSPNLVKPTVGDSGRYTKVTGTRKLARRVEYGAPAIGRELKDVSVQDVKLLHTHEKQQIPVWLMDMLRNYTDYELQNQGIDEITRQTQEFRQLFLNMEILCLLFSLKQGKIYFDGSGNMLPTSSGAVVTVDFGYNATTNGGQLQDAGGNTIITASWGTSSTDIPKQVRTIRKTARRRTGYPLKYALYGEAVPSYIAKNDLVKDWFARHPDKREQYLDTGEMPNGMLGLTWIPAYEAFFEDSSGTFQDVWGADDVVFCPEPDRSWLEKLEGTYPVPTSFNIVGDAAAANGAFKRVQGMFAYAKPCENPPAAFDVYTGNTFLHVPKVPNAVFNADVTP